LLGDLTPEKADAFRGHMLTEMARMSLDDGLVMQIHAGSYRNHSPDIFSRSAATGASTSRSAPNMSAR
jgi:glucuronate isomerase